MNSKFQGNLEENRTKEMLFMRNQEIFRQRKNFFNSVLSKHLKYFHIYKRNRIRSKCIGIILEVQWSQIVI